MWRFVINNMDIIWGRPLYMKHFNYRVMLKQLSLRPYVFNWKGVKLLVSQSITMQCRKAGKELLWHQILVYVAQSARKRLKYKRLRWRDYVYQTGKKVFHFSSRGYSGGEGDVSWRAILRKSESPTAKIHVIRCDNNNVLITRLLLCYTVGLNDL